MEKHEFYLEQLNKEIAIAYMKLLQCIEWNNPVFMRGIKEGLGKFVANAYISTLGVGKFKSAQYISPEALERINHKNYKGLLYEHVVPKEEYIFGPCKKEARDGTLTLDSILNHFQKYMVVTTITEEQNQLLDKHGYKNTMPSDWDNEDIFARYKKVGICYQENPHFLEAIKKYGEKLEKPSDKKQVGSNPQ